MSRPEFQTEALVLDRHPFRDSDWVLHLLTPHHGMLTALARGARGSRRRFAGTLEWFVLSRTRLRPPGGSSTAMFLVLEAEMVRVFPGILEDLGRLQAAQALLVLARDLLREAPVTEEVFRAVLAGLEDADRVPGEAAHGVLWRTALDLFASLGHPVDQDRCPGCSSPVSDWETAALGTDGILRCGSCGGPAAERFPARALRGNSGVEPGDRRRTGRLLSLWVSGTLGRAWSLPDY